jgi:hypothetical protein
MADDKAKKTKIDLKARLGKTAMGMGSPAAVPVPMPGPSSSGGPPPVAPESSRPSAPSSLPAAPIAAPSKPVGIAPPPGISPGIPLPPFAQQRQQASAAPKPTAAAQTIKVELGEEVVQERKKARRRTALYALLAAAVGVGVGWVYGGSQEKSQRAAKAREGAGQIEKDVKVANEKLKELSEKLAAAGQRLSKKDYPADLVKDLAAINIPFDATNLENRQVGSLPGKALKHLLAYTAAVADVNEQKESLKNVLGLVQAPVTKAWKDEKEPPAAFAIVLGRRGDNTAAELVTIKEPFLFAKDWPKEFKITKLEGNKPVDKAATKWGGGKADVIGGETAVAFPVEPRSVAAFTTEQQVAKLNLKLYELRSVLEGKKDNPTQETPGLVKDGEVLVDELHKIAIAK